LREINAVMDEQIEKGEQVVGELRKHADNLEGANDKRRKDNAALKERIRKMQEQLALMEQQKN
jgi:hypothetical protein